MMSSAVFRWNVITDSPTRSGDRSRTRRSTVARTSRLDEDQVGDGDPVMGIEIAGERASAPFGMRIPTVGMCSNESGIESRRMFMPRLPPEEATPGQGRCIA